MRVPFFSTVFDRSSRRSLTVGLLAIAVLLLTTGCIGGRKSVTNSFANAASAEPIANANPAKLALAEHLSKTGAKLYGAYWCPYCNRQKELFGNADRRLTLIECDPKGENAQPAACANANVSSYPTWEIKGKLYRGLRSLEELAVLSDYRGSLDFGG